ncbi:hypothetical protein [uncultured Paraglaciecola sp.]|uniref:hypothetical protein n=1 Tax=uncultured Paraglaciecola sp. TaxID=1765024 RepID=UPI0030DBD1D7|tara:strand:- start:41527 stop:42360 length:834 start_codon:yes stop_codon:yes gene_type:complete
MTENKYPDYIELLKLKRAHSIYIMAALTLGIDPRYLKIEPSVNNIHGEEVFTYEHSGSSSQCWYYPMKADGCQIEDYLNQESNIHPLAPIEGSSSLGIYNKGVQDELYQELKKLLLEAVKNEDIQCVVPEEYKSLDAEKLDQQIKQKALIIKPTEGSLVYTDSVKRWFKQNNLSTPFFGKPNELEGIPSVIDKNHPEHSLELGIAIEAWQRFSDLDISHPKEYIQNWLNEFHSSVDTKAKERICTLVNWRKQGGAKTQSLQTNIYQQAIAKNLPQKL